MAKTTKITKEKILETALEIAKEKGLEGVSNREIAKRMNSSIRPIYYQFKNVFELNKELYKTILKYFYNFLINHAIPNMPKYKQVGINYIKFAKEENQLFKILFMTNSNMLLDDFVMNDYEDFQEIIKIVKNSTNLVDDDSKSFHMKMWIFTHGIATLVATKTINFSDQEIEDLLTKEFKALMSLAKNN